MLFQPSYPQPYFSDVDGTKDSTFSCYINADSNTQVSAYQLRVNNLGGDEIYNSGRVILSNPLYGNQQLNMIVLSGQLLNGEDYTWNVDLYEEEADIWITSGIMTSFPTTGTSSTMRLRNSALVKVGMIVQNNNQKVTIIGINTSSNEYLQVTVSPSIVLNSSNPSYTVYDNKIQSSNYYFRARTTPTLVLESIPNQINSKSYTFKATYSQLENVGYKYFEWTIYDSVGNILNQSGQINVGEIVYTFDGFLNNTIYGVGLTVENQDGTVVTLQPTYFDVSYDLPSFENTPTAELVCNKDAVMLAWNPLLINNGVASNTNADPMPWYDYIQDQPYTGGSSVNIHSNSSISWVVGSENSPILIPYESTTYFYWHTEDINFRGVIYEQKGEYVDLLAMNTIPPANANKGDKYYNLKDMLIYTAIDTNIWGTTGETPSSELIYYLASNNTKYVWNGSDMINTDYDEPQYTISYNAGILTYTISNGNVNETGQIKVADVGEQWLLQPQSIQKTASYIWDSEQNWDDTLYWTETTQSILTDSWFKIILLPTEIQVEVIKPKFTISWKGDTTGLYSFQKNNIDYYKIQENNIKLESTNINCVYSIERPGRPSMSGSEGWHSGTSSYLDFTILKGNILGEEVECGQLWSHKGGKANIYAINIYTATDEYPVTGIYFGKYVSGYQTTYTNNAHFYSV